jgi:hypothetical protein
MRSYFSTTGTKALSPRHVNEDITRPISSLRISGILSPISRMPSGKHYVTTLPLPLHATHYILGLHCLMCRTNWSVKGNADES